MNQSPEKVPSTRDIMAVWTECGGLEAKSWIENFARAILAKFAGLPVVMGRGNVAVGTCKRAEDGIPGIIYLAIPEVREHGTDCADVYPVGSQAPRDKVLACIQFETPQVLQQSIDVLKELQKLHYPVAESAPPSLLNLMPEVIATLRAEGMSVNLVNKLELAMAEPAPKAGEGQEPVAYKWSLGSQKTLFYTATRAQAYREQHGGRLTPLYAHPAPQAAQPAVSVEPKLLVTLTGAQLVQALDYIASDRDTDTDQLECEASISFGQGHSGKGYYCWATDVAEDGAILLEEALPDGYDVAAKPAADDAMERALSELVDKIVPGLDTGDLVADAATASAALSTPPMDCKVAYGWHWVEYEGLGTEPVWVPALRVDNHWKSATFSGVPLSAVKVGPALSLPTAPPMEGLRQLIAAHAKMIEDGNDYAYFELAYTRRTSWMAWLCSKPSEDDPDRKVIAKGQGDTPDEAARSAIASMGKQPSTGGA